MTATLDRTLSIGKRLVGSYSRPNKFITWYVDKYKKPAAWLTAAWCAMFASFVLKSGGAKAGEFAYCPSWVKHFKDAKRWGTAPKVGAVAFFDWDKDKTADHVGIVVGVGSSKVKVLEGNTRVGDARNRVAVQSRSKSLIMGYGYPDYGESPEARTYVVRKGDSLSKIAALYDTTWQKLHAQNKATIGKDPKLITPGMVLTIP